MALFTPSKPYSGPMKENREGREYLRSVLKEHGIPLSDASRAVGKNHAYLQQFIVLGKPRVMPEDVREALVRLYPFLDAERLKPPLIEPKPLADNHSARRDSGDQPDVNPPSYGQFVDDPGTLEVLHLWGAIHPSQRELAKSILRTFAAVARKIIA